MTNNGICPGKRRIAELDEVVIPLTTDSLEEFKYHKVDEDNGDEESPSSDSDYQAFSFVSLKIKPDESNDLGRFTSYKPDGSDNKCKYVVFEFYV
jgi:hypothetical protein